jgi:hypothetical protein
MPSAQVALSYCSMQLVPNAAPVSLGMHCRVVAVTGQQVWPDGQTWSVLQLAAVCAGDDEHPALAIHAAHAPHAMKAAKWCAIRGEPRSERSVEEGPIMTCSGTTPKSAFHPSMTLRPCAPEGGQGRSEEGRREHSPRRPQAVDQLLLIVLPSLPLNFT